MKKNILKHSKYILKLIEVEKIISKKGKKINFFSRNKK